MKNLLIFLFGALVGAGGTFIYLRKEIKQELNDIREANEVPFTVGEDEKNGGNGTESKAEETKNNKNTDFNAAEVAAVTQREAEMARNEAKVAYNKIIDDISTGRKPAASVPVMPREESDDQMPTDNEYEGHFANEDGPTDGYFEIDLDEFRNDKSNEKENYIYYMGDHVMATENGTIITNPALLVGNNWESLVGKYKKDSAFIRNAKMCTDYEIVVDPDAYADRYSEGYIGDIY